MIHYRTFRNFDPPLVAEVWNASLQGPRTVAIPPRATGLLECITLAKPYFDPEGIFLAFEEDRPVGFAHASFAPNADGSAINHAKGVLCAIGVIASHRRQKIGTELLRRAEEYLRKKGAKEIIAGPASPENPFTFALYGGSDSVGFLASNGLARSFFEHHGYKIVRTTGIFQRSLKQMQLPGDPRFQNIHPRFEILGAPFSHAGWWNECVLGPIEAVEYRLQEKETNQPVAQIVLWDMATFAQNWGENCVGMLDLQVEPAYRRQGLGKYLLMQVLLHLNQQSFERFEVCVDLENTIGMAMLQALGFTQVETGHCFRRNP